MSQLSGDPQGAYAWTPTCLAREPCFGTPVAHPCGASLAPVAWQAPAAPSRGTGAQQLHLGLHPGFSSS